MLIFSQDRTMLLNIDSGIYTIEAKERWVVAIAGRRQVGAVMMEAQETVLGEYDKGLPWMSLPGRRPLLRLHRDCWAPAPMPTW